MDIYNGLYVKKDSFTDKLVGFIKGMTMVGSALLAALMITNSIFPSTFSILESYLKLNPKVTAPASTVYTPSPSPNSPTPEISLINIPYTTITYPSVGTIPSAHLEAKVSTGSITEPVTFLIDTGAKMTVLPSDYASKLQTDLNTAKRIYLKSATNNTTFGYIADAKLIIEDKTVEIPIAFADVIEPLLGMYGFFDRHTVTFDNINKQVIIK